MKETNQAVGLNPKPEIKQRGGFRPGAGRPRKPKPKGGSRPGAGRKRDLFRLLNRPSLEIARVIYEENNPREVFARLLRSKSDDVRLRAI